MHDAATGKCAYAHVLNPADYNSQSMQLALLMFEHFP